MVKMSGEPCVVQSFGFLDYKVIGLQRVLIPMSPFYIYCIS